MTPQEIREHIDALADEGDERMLFADGFDDALIGTAFGMGIPGQGPVVAYDYDKCVQILVGRGMDEDEAIEYLDFNTLGAYVGQGTPIFIRDLRSV